MKYEKIYLKDCFSVLGEENRNPTLEIYLPYNLKEMGRGDCKRPCMIVCPGGGYGMCSEREAEPIVMKFLPEGFNVFLLHYSVAPHRFPSQIREVAAVMELIYKNREEWNCDTERIAIIGFSAGAHLAAHYSTMYNCKEVREIFPESKPVNASVLSYPVITADFEHAHKGSFLNLIGHAPETQEEQDYFSCDKNVNDTTPPAYIWHTADDACVPVKNSFLYAEALAKYNIPFELHIFPSGEHGLATCDKETYNNITANVIHASEWINDVKRWLKLTFNY